MAVTSKELRSERSERHHNAMLHQRAHVASYGLTLLLAAIAIYGVVGLLVGKGRIMLDDLRYGRPRTFQISAYVDHEQGSGSPTHLMAINLNRQIVVVELPGSDPAKARTISGPYLFGASEDLTPVKLDLQDVDHDGKPDLLVDVRQEQIVFLNRDGAFRPPTPEEQARLLQGAQQ